MTHSIDRDKCKHRQIGCKELNCRRQHMLCGIVSSTTYVSFPFTHIVAFRRRCTRSKEGSVTDSEKIQNITQPTTHIAQTHFKIKRPWKVIKHVQAAPREHWKKCDGKSASRTTIFICSSKDVGVHHTSTTTPAKTRNTGAFPLKCTAAIWNKYQMDLFAFKVIS